MPRAVRSREAANARDRRLFRALADPTRRAILQALGAGEMRTKDLAARFPISRPATSKHLRVLLDAGLLTVRKEGRARWYSVAAGPLRDAAARVRELEAFWLGAHARLSEHLERDR